MVFLTLVRHGETEMNRAKMTQSRTHGDLTPEGAEMAEKLGLHLKDEKFTRVFSSDLRRCHDTTRNVIKHSNHHTADEIILTEILRERDFGDFELQPWQKVADLLASEFGEGYTALTVPIPGGEDHSDFKKRCSEFFLEICKIVDTSQEEENVLVVTHGGWIRTFLDYLTTNDDKFELENYTDQKHIPNTARTKLKIGKVDDQTGKRGIQFLVLVCTEHLKNE